MATQTKQASKRSCPYCKESIKAEAIKCRYCQSTIAPERPDHGGTCPFCKEDIHVEAIKCKHCKSDLDGGTDRTRAMLRAISVDQELEGQASHATGTSRLQRQAILLVDVLVAF